MQWPAGTVIEATEDIELDDSDGRGNQTVILAGARGVVCRDNLSIPPTDDGFVRLDRVEHFVGSTVFNASHLWRYQESFRVVRRQKARGLI